MCALCIRDCPFLCEVGLSALRGRRFYIPCQTPLEGARQPSLKDYRLDWSDFNIIAELLGGYRDPSRSRP
ncbi:MAG: hypothetical protein QXH67_01190 [Candidatus Bathyarchaeia archaeon]